MSSRLPLDEFPSSPGCEHSHQETKDQLRGRTPFIVGNGRFSGFPSHRSHPSQQERERYHTPLVVSFPPRHVATIVANWADSRRRPYSQSLPNAVGDSALRNLRTSVQDAGFLIGPDGTGEVQVERRLVLVAVPLTGMGIPRGGPDAETLTHRGKVRLTQRTTALAGIAGSVGTELTPSTVNGMLAHMEGCSEYGSGRRILGRGKDNWVS